jgi:hypothetical protein
MITEKIFAPSLSRGIMKSIRVLGSFFTSLMICTAVAWGGVLPGSSLMKKRVLADLDSIHHIFDVKYAPKSWKNEFANWDLDQSIAEAKSRVESLPAPSLKECQVILRDFFNSAKDYHVGVRFFSTESATLPFLVKGAEGRYFVSYVDRDQLSTSKFPFEVGDEILTFGNMPISKVIDDLRIREYGNNTLETDQALAEMALTQRRGDLGHLIPSGAVEVSGIKKGELKRLNVTLTWSYTPERIKDFSKLGAMADVQDLAQIGEGSDDLRSLLKKSQFFEKFMVSYLWDKSYVGSFTEMNKHSIGARTSFIPQLGKKIWQTASDDIFDAYIFNSPSGKKIGYVRIPHYMGEAEEVEEFGTIMNYFQKRTDALIIDQINNPGGGVFYLYALASTLTDKPLYAPKHHIAMTQQEVYIANLLLPYLEQVTNDETARTVLGDTMEGYPVDYQFVKVMKEFCHFLIAQWESGKLFSDPTCLFGVDEIRPHPKFRYTKPILLLVNSLDFSGGDFFPAILQDNKRATIFGTRTAGAGGFVLAAEFPNHSGMKGFGMTGSLAERIDKKPIENLGVRPDIHYDLSSTDLREDYKEYLVAILEAVEIIK